MTPQKPEWTIVSFSRRGRDGIRVIERQATWWMKPEPATRTVAEWGPHNFYHSRGYKKLIAARSEAAELVRKLEHAWPCTFLVKGYPYIPPPSE